MMIREESPIHNETAVLPFCRLSSVLDMGLQTWITWDEITVLANYRVMGEILWDILRQVENLQFFPMCVKADIAFQWAKTQSTPSCSREELNQLLHLDFLATCAHLDIVMSDRSKYREFLARKDEEAQCLLNLLQMVRFRSFPFSDSSL
jgi:hypothetical protein